MKATLASAPQIKNVSPRRKKMIYAWTVGMFIAPALLFYLTFTIFPVFKSLFYSFYKVEIFGIRSNMDFVGLDNFRAVFADPVFWQAAGNTLVWALTSPFLEIPLGLLLALYLAKGTKMTKWARVLWFMPVLLPQIVVGIIWAWVYHSEWGILNEIFRAVGLDGLARAWLGDPKTALPALIAVTTWMWTGFNMIILLAAVSSIPKELLEAAKIDGARGPQVLMKIIVPLMRPVIINLMILCFIGKMKVFDLIWATTQGGPLWATETVATYTVKRAFYWGTFEKGFPSAIATIWFLIILVIAVATTVALQKKKESLEF